MGGCLSSPDPRDEEQPTKVNSSVTAGHDKRNQPPLQDVSQIDSNAATRDSGSPAAANQLASPSGQQFKKDLPRVDSLIPSPSAPSGTASGTARISRGKAGAVVGSASASTPQRPSERRSSSTGASSSPMESPSGGMRLSPEQRPSAEGGSAAPIRRRSVGAARPEGDNPLMRTSLTGKVGTYLRRHSSEGTRSSIEMIRQAGQSLKTQAHGEDKEHTSSHAIAAIDPSMYY